MGSHPKSTHKPKDAIAIGFGATANGPQTKVKNADTPVFGESRLIC